jgi:hypothetical protein
LNERLSFYIKPADGLQLPAIMQWVKQTFAVRFNRRTKRTGHVWGDRYWSRVVEGEPPEWAAEVDWEAVATARKAVAEKALSTVAFVRADIAELPDNFGVFDMIIGRRVLMYQSDVSRAIGSLLPFLAKNGKMVFQESDCMGASFSSPALPLHTKALNWIWDTVAKEGGNIHIGTRLYSEMKNAGLSISLLRAEAILHTYESGSDLG